MNSVDYTVYLVTDAVDRYPHGLLANVEAAVSGGATVVQYRATTGSRRSQYETAWELRDLLRSWSVPLIINDYVDLALAVDADGVHVGQTDMPVDAVRRLLGPRKLLGLSITRADQVENLTSAIDYIGVGPVYPTPTKADAADAIGVDELASIARKSSVPVVAIGGINLTNAAAVFGAGVHGVAVVSAFSQSPEPAEVARRLRKARDSLRT